MFQIALLEKDLELLKLIKTYFGEVGVIYNIKSQQSNMCALRINSIEQIALKVFTHFDTYPLITQKQADYLLFKDLIKKMIQKDHLKKDKLQELVNIRASLNLGLSDLLKYAFPNTIPVPRPQINLQEIPHPEWMAGFTSGDGCFFIHIKKGRNKCGIGVSLFFQITQHKRDEQLLKSFMTYFKCGNYTFHKSKNYGHYLCTKFEDNYNKIIPFFNQYLIRGTKYKDFLDWVKVAEIIHNKEHLTEEGSSKILQIKKSMNTGREDFL